MHENVISSYYKNIPDIKTCHDRIADRIWKREITVTEVKNANEFRSQGNGMKKGWVSDFWTGVMEEWPQAQADVLRAGFGQYDFDGISC